MLGDAGGEFQASEKRGVKNFFRTHEMVSKYHDVVGVGSENATLPF